MKKTIFASEEEAVQYLADITGKKIIVAETEEKTLFKPIVKRDLYFKEEITEDNQRVVLEKYEDMFEVELYKKKDDQWRPVQSMYFESLEEAEDAFEELIEDLN